MDTHLVLSLFHIFAVVPFFLYIALNRANTPLTVYKVAFVVGLVITLYHAYKAFLKWKAGSQSLWVNVMHMLFFGPLLIYIGYMEQGTPRAAYELLALAGFAALGYHIYYLIVGLNIQKASD
jgi:hypothetical protein